MVEIVKMRKYCRVGGFNFKRGFFAAVYHAGGKTKVLASTSRWQAEDRSVFIYRPVGDGWAGDWYKDIPVGYHYGPSQPEYISALVRLVNAANDRQDEWQAEKNMKEEADWENLCRECTDWAETFASTRKEYAAGSVEAYEILVGAACEAAHVADSFQRAPSVNDVVLELNREIDMAGLHRNSGHFIEMAKNLVLCLETE